MATTAALEHRLLPPVTSLPEVDVSRMTLPPQLRPGASLGVLDVTEWFGETSGGIRTYLLQKMRYVENRQDLRHVLVVPGSADAVTEGDGVRCYRLRGPRIPTQTQYRFMLATRSLGRIARHEQPDLIEVGSPFVVPWIVRHATRDLDIPLVCFYHSNVPRLLAPAPETAGVVGRALGAAAWRYMRRLDRLFPLTIVASDFARADLEREGIDRIAHVPLGVDLAQFHPRRRQVAAETRRRLGIDDGPVIGFVGRFAREKEVHVLIDAWPEIERRTGASLVLIGDGPSQPSLAARVISKRVHWLPFERDRDALADLLAALDLYVAPCSIETFGLSALEALASGTPVLSADQGGVSELVAQSGAGSTFASGVSASLAEEAVSLLADDLASMGTAARAYAENEHDWSTVFDRMFAVYRELLAR